MAQSEEKIDNLISSIDKVQSLAKTGNSNNNRNEINFRSSDFLINHMKQSAQFFSPKRAVDPSGGFYHFFGDDGSVYDKTTRVLVTQARFIFTYAVAYEYLQKKEYLDAVEHGIKYLRGPLRNTDNGAYYWVITVSKEGIAPSETKIFTYGLAFCLLAYSKAFGIGLKQCKEYIYETFDLMEKYLFEPKYGLYAEEADSQWNVTDYRSESGNLHTCEALIAAYEATNDIKFYDRAVLIANNVCNRQAGLCYGLVWEHYNVDWSIDMTFNNDSDAMTIFRPWGVQPGHQVEWARLLLVLNEFSSQLNQKNSKNSENKVSTVWLVRKAVYLFDVAMDQAWDDEYGGLAYSFDPKGTICDFDKIFWVHCESIGTAAMLAVETGNDKYWKYYDNLWKISWKYFVDHKNGSWYRRGNRKFEMYFKEKTKHAKCVDPDYHILGGFDGALRFIKKLETK